MNYEEEYHKLVAERAKEREEWHKEQLEMVDKYLVQNSRLININEHTPKMVGYISLFLLGLIIFVFRPDIFVMIIEAFKGCKV